MCTCRVEKSIILLYRESFWLVSKIIEVCAISNRLFKQICIQPNGKKPYILVWKENNENIIGILESEGQESNQ